ncbi:MAG TPA: CAP domain-containing protein [Polyangiaceae bacterium]
MVLALGLGLDLGACGDGIARPIRLDTSMAGQSSIGGTTIVTSEAHGGTVTLSSSNGGNSSNSAKGGATSTSSGGDSPGDAFGIGGRTPGTGPFPPGGQATNSSDIRRDACNAELKEWPEEQVAAEDALLAALNEARQSGKVTCNKRPLQVAGALVMVEQLRCLARDNSDYMLSTGALTTQLVEGGPPGAQAIISDSSATNVDVTALLQRMLAGGTDCVNLMDPRFQSVGVGFAAGSNGGYWTIVPGH